MYTMIQHQISIILRITISHPLYFNLWENTLSYYIKKYYGFVSIELFKNELFELMLNYNVTGNKRGY